MGVTYIGGKGTVKIGKSKIGKGLRNKRKSYWSKLRMAELKERIRIAKAERYSRNNDEPRY